MQHQPLEHCRNLRTDDKMVFIEIELHAGLEIVLPLGPAKKEMVGGLLGFTKADLAHGTPALLCFEADEKKCFGGGRKLPVLALCGQLVREQQEKSGKGSAEFFHALKMRG